MDDEKIEEFFKSDLFLWIIVLILLFFILFYLSNIVNAINQLVTLYNNNCVFVDVNTGLPNINISYGGIQ